MAARLVVRGAQGVEAVHVLGAASVTLGRDEDNDIVLDSNPVSRRHAQVTWDGRQYVLHDLGSKNGTLLNGRQVTGPEPLQPGDVITLAGVAVTFHDARGTSTWTPDGPPEASAAPGDAVRVDVDAAEVWVGGRRVDLTAKEYRALVLFSRKGGALVPKDEFAASVWPEYQGAVSDDTMEKLIYRLRRKLETDPEHPRHLITVRGLGYRFHPS